MSDLIAQLDDLLTEHTFVHGDDDAQGACTGATCTWRGQFLGDWRKHVAEVIAAHVESTKAPSVRWYAAAEVKPDGGITQIGGQSMSLERATEDAEWFRRDRRRFIGIDVETCVAYKDIPQWRRMVHQSTEESADV